MPRYLVYSLVWSFSGDGKMLSREALGNFIRSVTTIGLPPPSLPIIDYEASTCCTGCLACMCMCMHFGCTWFGAECFGGMGVSGLMNIHQHTNVYSMNQ